MSDLTRAEAIEELKEMRTDAWTDTRQMKALEMAINSLEVDEENIRICPYDYCRYEG